MSDFLLNLARRSAGLAPVVRARSMPMAQVTDVVDGAVATPDTAAGARIEARAHITPKSAASVVSQAPAATVNAQPPVHASLSASNAVVRRMPVAAVAPARAAKSVDAPASARADVGPFAAPRAALQTSGDTVTPIAPLSTPPRSDGSGEESSRPRERVTELATVEMLPDAGRPAAPIELHEPIVAKIEPAGRAAPVSAVSQPRGDPVPDRTVHVRIGAIEIRPAEVAVQQPASIAAPAPAPASTVAAPSGFEQYVALRSYAPWAW